MVDGINLLGKALQGVGLGILGDPLAGLSVRGLDFTVRSILALTVGYSAFISEIFLCGHRVHRARAGGGRGARA